MKIMTLADLQALLQTMGMTRFIEALFDYMQQDFQQWQSFKMTPRHVTHYEHGVMELMPAATDELYAYKFVNGHPGNPNNGDMTVVALGCLAEVSTGYPLMICEMTLLTAFRTAVTSAMASRYLARQDAHVMAMIGTGAQSEFQVLAHQALCGIDTVHYYDIDAAAMDKFEANLSGQGIALHRATTVAEAVAQADIVTTATAAKRHGQVIDEELLRPGMHFNAIGGDCDQKTEFDPGVLSHCKIVIEHLPQTQLEGEMQCGQGSIHAELWELVQQKKPGRVDDNEITLFDSVGVAIEDYATLRCVYQLLNDHAVGSDVALIPPKGCDPKNLFSLMMPA